MSDTAAARPKGKGDPCLLETAQSDRAGAGETAALLYESLTDSSGAHTTVVESCGLRFRPRWSERRPGLSVQPLDLLDSFPAQLRLFLALDDAEDEALRLLLHFGIRP